MRHELVKDNVFVYKKLPKGHKLTDMVSFLFGEGYTCKKKKGGVRYSHITRL